MMYSRLEPPLVIFSRVDVGRPFEIDDPPVVSAYTPSFTPQPLLGIGGLLLSPPPLAKAPPAAPPEAAPPLALPPFAEPPVATTPPAVVDVPPVVVPPLGAPPLGDPFVVVPPLGAPPLSDPPFVVPPLGAPPRDVPPEAAPPPPEFDDPELELPQPMITMDPQTSVGSHFCMRFFQTQAWPSVPARTTREAKSSCSLAVAPRLENRRGDRSRVGAGGGFSARRLAAALLRHCALQGA